MANLQIDRPLAFLDLETTGTDPAQDRIVEISVLRVEPDGTREAKTRRLNPERPIPEGASRVHGIRDEDVRDAPTFRQVARSLLDFLGEADLAGFNVSRFDIPLLEREFRDCGLDLGLDRRRVIDAMTIFHRQEPRDLSAAVRFYLGREPHAAHSAEADVAMTVDVLEAQLERYGDLPRTVDALAEWCRPSVPGGVDREGKFVWRQGEAVLGFGKHEGRPLRQVALEDPDYLDWISRSDFPNDAREIARQALSGSFPDQST